MYGVSQDGGGFIGRCRYLRARSCYQGGAGSVIDHAARAERCEGAFRDQNDQLRF
jgi:hypothetical protein